MAMVLQGKWEEAEAAPSAQAPLLADGTFPEPSDLLRQRKELRITVVWVIARPASLIGDNVGPRKVQ